MLKEFAQSQPIAMKFYYFLVYCKCKAAFALFSHYILLHVSFLITFRISENLLFFFFFRNKKKAFIPGKLQILTALDLCFLISLAIDIDKNSIKKAI